MNTSINTCISPRDRGGFTLLELLIVIAIGGILMGMLSGLLLLAKRQAMLANTRAVLMKVDQAIRLFKTDVRIYPWQTDLGAAPAEPAAWDNDLAWRLAWRPPASGHGTATDPDRLTYLRAVQDDIAAIQKRFRFVDGCNVPPSGDQSEGTHAFRLETQTASSRTNLLLAPGSLQTSLATIEGYSSRYIPGTAASGTDCTADAMALTKMAEEVTILAYTAGQLPTLAPSGIDPALPDDKARFPQEDERYPSVHITKTSPLPYRYFPYNKAGFYGDDSRGPALSEAAARARGWRADYLADALDSGSGGGHADIDAAGRAVLDAWGHPLVYVCRVRPGVRGCMPGLTTSIFSGTREERYNLGPQGRDVTGALASDIRTTAAAAYACEFELWSAGPDGAFAAARDAIANRDNIALQPYTRGLR